MPSNHLILCRPLLLLPSVFPSIRVFSSESVFTWGGQSIGVSASALVLPMNIQDWFSLGWTGLISLQSKEQASFNFMAAVTIFNDFGAQENKVCHCLNCFPIFLPWSDGTKGFSRVFSNTTVQKHQFFGAQLYSPTLTSIHDYWKNHSFDQTDLYLLRILQWVAIPFSWGSSQPRDQTWDSCIAGRFFTVWATREALLEFQTSAEFWGRGWKFCLSPPGKRDVTHKSIFFFLPVICKELLWVNKTEKHDRRERIRDTTG